MKTMFLSRKNLVAMAIAALFAFNFIVIGLLLLNVAAINNFLKLPIIAHDHVGVGDQVGVAVTGVFLFLLVFGIIFIYRLQRLNGHKFFSKKVLVANSIFAAIWLVVVLLINLIAVLFDFGSFGQLLLTELMVFVLTLGSGIIISIPLGAIIVLIVNFVNMGRPYGFFQNELMPDFGDDFEETDVTKSFGEENSSEGEKGNKKEEKNEK